MESFYNKFPKGILPKEYGGNEESGRILSGKNQITATLIKCSIQYKYFKVKKSNLRILT